MKRTTLVFGVLVAISTSVFADNVILAPAEALDTCPRTRQPTCLGTR